MGRSSAWLAGIALVLGCSERQLDPVCVTTQVVEAYPCAITPSGLMLSGGQVIQLHEDGTTSDVATLELDLEVSRGCGSFAHDPSTGRMWLIDTNWDSELPARLHQFDATGQLEWEMELIHEGRISKYGGEVYQHEGAVYVAARLDPPDPIDPNEPFLERDKLLIERLDHAGEVVWARADYLVPDEVDIHFASGEDMHMTDDGLALIATPPLIDYGPSYPLVVDEQDGAVLWSGADGEQGLHSIAKDDRVTLAWPTFASYELGPDGLRGKEIAPAGSVLSVHSPTGEPRASSEVAWPGWDELYTKPAFLGDRIVTLVSTYDGPVGVTVHTRDGVLECKQILDDLGNASIEFVVGLDGREQVAVVAELVPEDPEDLESYEYVTVLLGPLP
jgi:hypothetical protein